MTAHRRAAGPTALGLRLPQPRWAVLVALCSGQFVMVLDSTVMNVSIEKVIVDLHTTVSTMQLAISTYTLTTAALILVGGKLGDIIGRRLAFRIGLVTFGAGALVTALAPSMAVLILGWSIVEAVGAALMIPATIALLASNYEGRDRTIAYGAIGGIAGAAGACGPIVGGWVATVGSWRDVFAGEAVVMVALLGVSAIVRDAPLGRARPRMDVTGAVLSAGGLALAVLGIVQSTTWGWIGSKQPPRIGGSAVEPFGLSVVPFLIVAGLVLLAGFAVWERWVAGRGRDTLVDLAMLRAAQLRAGLGTMAVMFLCLGGVFFVMPLYLQIVLGKDPLQTGIDLLPMSLGVFFVAMVASRLSSRIAPRRLIVLGFLGVATGAGLLILTIERTFDPLPFAGSVLVVGTGLGLIASQVTNVNLASAGPAKTSETGALQGTAQNLGSALGTAIIGSLLLSVLTATFDHRVYNDASLPLAPRHTVSERTRHGLSFLPADAAAATLRHEGVRAQVVDELQRNYAQSEIDALKIAVGGIALIALLGLGTTRRLPSRPCADRPNRRRADYAHRHKMRPAVAKLVGRSDHVEAFDRALAGLTRGRPALLGLAGEPGIGKTRLLAELAARAEARGCLVLRGSASELQGELPFGVFVDALDEYVQGLAPGVLAGLDAEIRDQLGHVLPSQPAPPRDLPVERFRIHRSLRELLQALGGARRLVLLLDDVHWADSGSVDLLGMLLRRPSPGVLIAIAVRPRQLPERLAVTFERAASSGDLTRLEVGRLSEAEAAELLGGAPSDAVYEQSAGNPFYLQQLARFPAREAAGAIRDEVGLLSADARRVLEGAGVVGDPFELDLAAAAAGVTEEATLEALDELLHADLVRPSDVPRRFCFRHPLIRQAVYETTPGGWRIAAHARTGTALSARGAPAEALAHHVEQSGRHGDAAAIAVLREAGSSVAQRTPAGAARWYAAALRLMPADAPLDERTELLTAAASAATAGGRFAEALAALDEAERLVAVDDGLRRAGVAGAIAQVQDLMSRHGDARRRLEAAAGAIDDLPGPQAVSLAQQLVINAVYRGANEEADRWARRAREVAHRAADRSLLASSTAALAFVAGMAGRVQDALVACDEATALMDAMGDAEVASCVLGLCHLGTAELYLDRLGAGVVHAQRALTVARATGQVQLFPMIAPMAGWVLTVGGRLDAARDVLDGAAEAARLTGSAQALAWVLYTRTMNALYRGDLAVAVADGDESFELTSRLEMSSGIACYAGVVYGLALAEIGEPARGIAVASERAGGPGLPRIPPAWRGFFLDRLVPAWLALGRRDDADAAAAEAERAAALTGLRSARSSALRARARVELDAGEAGGAAEHATAAGDIAEGIGARVAAGASRVLAGRALDAAGDPAGAVGVLERAADELDTCGAMRLRGEAERELGRLGRRRSRRSRPRSPAADDDMGVGTLTERELEVARLIVDRRTNAQIADELFVSKKTVESHVRHLFEKLGASSRVDVARTVERVERDR